MNYKKALLKNLKQQKPASVSGNRNLQRLILELQKIHPEKTPLQIQTQFDEAEGLYSKASQLDKEIAEMEKKLEALKAESKKLKKGGDKLTICTYLKKSTESEKLHPYLSRWVYDILHREFGIPDYQEVIKLYELMLLHYPKNRDEALLQLALIYLKGKIDNENREKEHRRQVLSNPEKGEFYAQMIEDPTTLAFYVKKSKKYLAKKKI
jgi:tetratricopeptide (TPR) repeat protein